MTYAARVMGRASPGSLVSQLKVVQIGTFQNVVRGKIKIERKKTASLIANDLKFENL